MKKVLKMWMTLTTLEEVSLSHNSIFPDKASG